MKSIIQEASTLTKAIEQGWIKAGKPNLFSIKIMQEPSKNFIGMTMQTAKIVVFCGRLDEIDTASPQQQPQQPQTHRQPQPQQQSQAPKTSKEITHRPLKQHDQPRNPQKNYQRYPQKPPQQPVKQPTAQQANKPPIPENKPKQ